MKLFREYINYCEKKAEESGVYERYTNPVKHTTLYDLYNTYIGTAFPKKRGVRK